MPTELQREIILIIQIWILMNWVQIWLELLEYEQKREKKGSQRKKRQRRKPEEFQGLTKKPVCEACQATASHQTERPIPPPMIKSKRGRPRKVDTHKHYCPDQECQYYGWLGRGNMRANGHPNGGQTRQLQCKACQSYFAETMGTIFYGSRVPAETKLRAIAALAEGLGIGAVGRVFEVEADTVWNWLVEAAEHVEAFSNYLLHDLKIEQVQLDELYGVLRAVKAGEMGPEEADQRLKKRSCWVWAALDPVSKLLMGVVVGERRLPMGQQLVHQVAEKLAVGCVPLFMTDGLAEYGTAILTHFGHWVARQNERGRQLKPRWMPLPQLNYAQVVKKRCRRRLVQVSRRVIYGSLEGIKTVLARHGWQINTAFIERFNLTFRHHVPALGRRVNTLAKTEEGLKRQCMLAQTYYNFVLPHASLGLAVIEPSTQKWQPQTPAMAAGATDQLWSLDQLLRLRMPPWPQEAAA